MGQVIVGGRTLKCKDCGSTDMEVDPGGSCRHDLRCGKCKRGWVHITSGSTMECSCQRRGMR